MVEFIVILMAISGLFWFGYGIVFRGVFAKVLSFEFDADVMKFLLPFVVSTLLLKFVFG